jgi:dephospho-CoA kinase
MIIIGITGTLGAGKGTIVEYLVLNKGFDHYSVRAFLLEEIRKRQLSETRDSMVVVANDLRKKHDPSYVTDQLFNEASHKGKNCIIESIRTVGEIESLRKKGRFYLFAVDADPQLRYERIRLRQSETDHITFQTFIANEERESVSSDPGVQNLKACIALADFLFSNNSGKEALFMEVETVLEKIQNNDSPA